MRILITWPGLQQTSHFALLEALAEIGHHEWLVLWPERELPVRQIPGVQIVYSPVLDWVHPVFHVQYGWHKAAEGFQPEIVLCWWEPYCLNTWLFNRWANSKSIPLVFYSAQNIDRPLSVPIRSWETAVLKTSAGGWFVNSAAIDRVRQRGYQGAAALLPLGFDAAEYPSTPERTEPIQQPCCVGYVGRMIRSKGLEDLFRAAEGQNWRLVLVGEGPDLAEFKNLATKFNLQVDWGGHVSPEKLMECYHQIDVLVLPSRSTRTWKEQFGRVLIEAMACGCVVSGADCGEIPNVIQSWGIVYPEGDFKTLRRKINLLAASPQTQQLYQQRMSRFRVQFQWQSIAVEMDRFLTSLVK